MTLGRVHTIEILFSGKEDEPAMRQCALRTIPVGLEDSTDGNASRPPGRILMILDRKDRRNLTRPEGKRA